MKKICFFLLFFKLNSLNDNQISIDYEKMRDPFSLKEDKKNVSLISILTSENIKLALVKYKNNNFFVKKNEVIDQKWKVVEILEKEIILESLTSNKRKMVLLDEN